jgi:peptidoglycan/xylan/chitin deacetylase (PgdA/CDA1 family)
MTRALRPLIRVLGAPLAALAVTVLRLSSRRVGIALLYHSIAESSRPPEEDIVPPHPPELFGGQVRHVGRWYRVVDSTELLEAVASRRRGERFPIAITFDDDVPYHVAVALPILRDVGTCATFFLCGASLERPSAFWWERLQRAFDVDPVAAAQIVRARSTRELPSLTGIRELAQIIEHMEVDDREEVGRALGELVGPDPDSAGIGREDVRTLADAGMTVGFHTLRHDPLDALDKDDLAEALTKGREQLSFAAGRALDAIAYPHGRTNHRVADAARAAGFSVGFSAQGLPVGPDDDPLLVPRITPSYRSTGHMALHLFLVVLRAGHRGAT